MPATSPLEHSILFYTLILIASFLAALMMLWHISTAHLVDDYHMPHEWYVEFISTQFPNWRIALWVGLFITVRCSLNGESGKGGEETLIKLGSRYR